MHTTFRRPPHMRTSALLAALAGIVLTVPGLAWPNTLIHDPTIELVIYFEYPPDPNTYSDVQRELAAVMRPLGINWKWKLGSEIVLGEQFNHPVIIRIRGRCEVVGEGSSQGLASGALGHTELVDGEILRFARVDCDRIREYIRCVLRGQAWRRRQQLLGRAVARVLAHELYHILGQTKHHARRGIASPCLSIDDLTSNELKFESADWDRMFKALNLYPPVVYAGGGTD